MSLLAHSSCHCCVSFFGGRKGGNGGVGEAPGVVGALEVVLSVFSVLVDNCDGAGERGLGEGDLEESLWRPLGCLSGDLARGVFDLRFLEGLR